MMPLAPALEAPRFFHLTRTRALSRHLLPLHCALLPKHSIPLASVSAAFDKVNAFVLSATSRRVRDSFSTD